VILLLVSADFLASDFAYEEEMLRAIERAHHGEATVIGVMLRPVDGWESSPLGKFQVLPRTADRSHGGRTATKRSATSQSAFEGCSKIESDPTAWRKGHMSTRPPVLPTWQRMQPLRREGKKCRVAF
jgi:hypothetical protein